MYSPFLFGDCFPFSSELSLRKSALRAAGLSSRFIVVPILPLKHTYIQSILKCKCTKYQRYIYNEIVYITDSFSSCISLLLFRFQPLFFCVTLITLKRIKVKEIMKKFLYFLQCTLRYFFADCVNNIYRRGVSRLFIKLCIRINRLCLFKQRVRETLKPKTLPRH